MAEIIDFEVELPGGRKVVINASQTPGIKKDSSNRLYQYANRHKRINK